MVMYVKVKTLQRMQESNFLLRLMTSQPKVNGTQPAGAMCNCAVFAFLK